MKDTRHSPEQELIRTSVVIPCYNQGRFLAEAIQSVLDQDYPNKEVIVVNDGSSDNTSGVAASFGDLIVYIEQPNGGAARARNTGIQAAQGEHIAFLDADDVCFPGRLALQASILSHFPPIGLVAGDAHLIDSAGNSLGLKSSVSGAPANTEDFRWETVGYCATTSTVMVRRACFESVGYFEEREVVRNAGEDWLCWVKISHDFSMRYLSEATTGYRVHDTNLTRFTDRINQGNRIACGLAVAWDRFPTYPAHFRAKLLFYRFATAWRFEPKSQALSYLLRAVATDPTQLPYGLHVIRLGLANTVSRRRRRT